MSIDITDLNRTYRTIIIKGIERGDSLFRTELVLAHGNGSILRWLVEPHLDHLTFTRHSCIKKIIALTKQCDDDTHHPTVSFDFKYLDWEILEVLAEGKTLREMNDNLMKNNSELFI